MKAKYKISLMYLLMSFLCLGLSAAVYYSANRFDMFSFCMGGVFAVCSIINLAR